MNKKSKASGKQATNAKSNITEFAEELNTRACSSTHAKDSGRDKKSHK